MLLSVFYFNQILGTQFCMEVVANVPVHFQLMKAVIMHILRTSFTTKCEMRNALILMKLHISKGGINPPCSEK